MTGDEDVADAALEAALKTALECVDEARGFPCQRSWMFANLLRALKGPSSSIPPDIGTVGWVSLIQVPPQERAILVLVDGLGFDLPTTSLITLCPIHELEEVLTKARYSFRELSAAFNFSSRRLDSE